MSLHFEVVSSHEGARCGRLETPHGVLATPAFAPVGTLGAVKGVAPQALEQAGADILLANLYHLAVRPGVEAITELGGLHAFCGWPGPILTDSGGFQVFSLAALTTIDDDGVTFRSHLDGAEMRFTPESVARMQAALGVDIAMMLDECPPWPVTRDAAAAALERTNRWARRGRAAWNGAGGFFGIVQGSVYPELRRRAVEELAAMAFDGYAIGGVSVGEPAADRRAVVELTAPRLPDDKVRYLMGVGTPRDIAHGVLHGVDLFDCVLPSRNARHGLLFTRGGPVKIKNARHRLDARPLDEDCGCPACRRVSRAFLHHLFRTGELTGQVLATLHNIRYYLDFMGDLREAIASEALADRAARILAHYPEDEPSRQSSEPAGSPASNRASQE